MPIKVAVVDDDEGIRASLAALIRRGPNFRLTGDYPDAETALKEIPRRPPDVVLMDINLPGVNGVECVRQLKAALPSLQLLMLTVYEDSDSLFNSLKAGASGYRRMIADEIALAHQLHDLIGEQDELERGTCDLSITTFRYVPSDLKSRARDAETTDYLNELNARIATAMRLSGEAFVSNHYIEGRYMLRACIVNFRTTHDDVAMLPPLVVRLGRELDAKLRR